MTSQQLTLPLFGETSTSLPGDSRASRSASPASNSAKRMNATCGRTCLEQFGRFGRVGSWRKTFAALLLNQAGWSSSRCALVWKLQATKYNRLYFLLQASALPTAATGCGLSPTPQTQGLKVNVGGKRKFADLSMLPTPNASEGTNYTTKYNPKSQMGKGLTAMAINGLIPTPLASEVHHAERVEALKEAGGLTMRSRKNGATRPNGIIDYLHFNDMLPTPTAIDAGTGRYNTSIGKNAKPRPTIASCVRTGLLITPAAADGMRANFTMESLKNHKKAKGDPAKSNLAEQIAHGTPGGNSRLNPLFVGEMMGYPEDWLVLPFLNGENKRLRCSETR